MRISGESGMSDHTHSSGDSLSLTKNILIHLFVGGGVTFHRTILSRFADALVHGRWHQNEVFDSISWLPLYLSFAAVT